MATNHTEHYNLSQWVKTDPVLMSDFNEDNAKIDAALAGKGNCQVVFGSYVGTGKYRESEACSLTFAKKPLMVFIVRGLTMTLFRGCEQATAIGSNVHPYPSAVVWSGNTVKWYNSDTAAAQMNTEGTTYQYFAILVADET